MSTFNIVNTRCSFVRNAGQCQNVVSLFSRLVMISLFLQVYQIDNGRYIFTDKYRGRILSVEGFRSALNEFIDNGRTKRFDILTSIIERLQSLHQTITGLGNYRFYSGSLLVVYDGSTSSDLVDLRMIDFAHSLLIQSTGEFDPDQDYLFGLERLIDVFREILANQNQQKDIH